MALRKQHIMYPAIATVVAAVSIGLGLAYCGIRTSLAAERALHATLLVLDLVREYVVDRQGAWPRCWQDLERLPGQQRGMFHWPEDGEAVQRYVWVDFGADPNKLVSESVEHFAAVRPKAPCYPYKHYPEMTKLLDAIRQSRHGDGQTRPHQPLRNPRK